MPKYYLGIDPGLTNTGLALINAQDQLVDASLILVNATTKIKRVCALVKKVDVVNYKLQNLYNRLFQQINDWKTRYNFGPEDVEVILEGFWYQPKTNPNQRQNNNYVFETVAGVTIAKCVLFNTDLKFKDIMPVQVKMILSWLADGQPERSLDKKDIARCVGVKLSALSVDNVLNKYAERLRQHLSDAMALALCAKYYKEYTEYMKIPLKKRKAMAAIK